MKAEHVGTEHLLLGLALVREGVAAQVLEKVGVTPDKLRAEVVPDGAALDGPSFREPKLTRGAKRVLEVSAHESRRLRHNYIGTEHLLLAVIADPSEAGSVALARLVALDELRERLLAYIDSGYGNSAPSSEPLGQPEPTPVTPAASTAPAASKEDRLAVLVLQYLLRKPDGAAARLLGECGLDVERARDRLRRFTEDGE